MRENRKCLYCGSEFKPYSVRNVYCSKKCAHRKRNGVGNTLQEWESRTSVCFNCGNTFTPNHQRVNKYCSDHCRKQSVNRCGISDVTFQLLYDQQRGKCMYCQDPVYRLRQGVLEHIDSKIKKTPEDGFHNWVFSCTFCNTSKNNHNLHDWLMKNNEYDYHHTIERLKVFGKRIPEWL